MGNEKVCVVLCAFNAIDPRTHHESMILAGHPKIHYCATQVGTLLPKSRNEVVKQVNPEATHIWFIDSDMCDLSFKLLDELLAADVDIICPIMTSRLPPFTPACGYLEEPDFINSHAELAELAIKGSRNIEQVAWCGTACTLVKREVFDKIPPPYFEIKAYPNRVEIEKRKKEIIESAHNMEPEEVADKLIELGFSCRLPEVCGEDVDFCMKARAADFKIFIHTKLFISHLGTTRYNFGDFVTILQNPQLKSRMEILTHVWETSCPN